MHAPRPPLPAGTRDLAEAVAHYTTDAHEEDAWRRRAVDLTRAAADAAADAAVAAADGRAALLASIVDGTPPPPPSTDAPPPGAELRALLSTLQAEQEEGASRRGAAAAAAAAERTATFTALLARLAAASTPADLEAADAAYAALRGRPAGPPPEARPARTVVGPGVARVDGGAPPPPPPDGAAVEL